jgi:hypothetical protein
MVYLIAILLSFWYTSYPGIKAKEIFLTLRKNPGPEGPALSSPLKGDQAPSIHETGQPVEPVLPVGRLLAGING